MIDKLAGLALSPRSLLLVAREDDGAGPRPRVMMHDDEGGAVRRVPLFTHTKIYRKGRGHATWSGVPDPARSSCIESVSVPATV